MLAQIIFVLYFFKNSFLNEIQNIGSQWNRITYEKWLTPDLFYSEIIDLSIIIYKLTWKTNISYLKREQMGVRFFPLNALDALSVYWSSPTAINHN